MTALLSASLGADQHQMTLLLPYCNLCVYVPMCVKPVIHFLTRVGSNFFCRKQKSRCLRLLRGSKGSREQLCVLECRLLYVEAAPAQILEVAAWQTTACTWGFNHKHGHGRAGVRLSGLDLGSGARGTFLLFLQKSINSADL